MANMQTATRLKLVLIAEGRKQSWLAPLAGVHPTTLSYIVSGRVNPNATEQAAIAAALGRSVDDLFPVTPSEQAA